MFEDKDSSLTPISSIGEFGLIDHLTGGFPTFGDKVVAGPGDDAAVYGLDGDDMLVVTTDLLVEGVHFDLAYVPLQHLGYKAVAVNLSDLAAMNAAPEAITVSVAMSNRFTVEAMDALYEGIRACCEKYEVNLIGGDMSASRSGLVINITAFGKAKKDEIIYRSGAEVNDLICHSGDLGAAYAGFQVLEREKHVYQQNPDVQPDLDTYDYVVGRFLKPEPRFDILKLLKENGIHPTSMIDLSDGLASDIHHICKRSNVGAQLFQEKLLVDHQTVKVAEELNLHQVNFALNGGEDYELLFTVPVNEIENIAKVKDIHVIGHVTEAGYGVKFITKAGETVDVMPAGYNHFRDHD